MSKPRRHLNPSHLSPMRQTLSAVGMGISVAGVGAALADIYRKPSIAIGSMVFGIGLAALHLPWADLLNGEDV